MARRRRRSRKGIGGWHTLRGFVSPKRRRFVLKRRSRFKRKMRGFKVNPALAAYTLNPRRRYYRGNPAAGLTRSITGVFNPQFVLSGAAGLGGMIAVVTLGNTATAYIAPYLPAAVGTGPMAAVVKAALRGGVLWAINAVAGNMLGRQRMSFNVGAGVAIAGSALLDLMGKSFVLGAGDGAQTIQSFVPTGVVAGLRGPYMRPALPGMGSYSRTRLAGMRGNGGGAPSGMAGIGNSAHRRLYSGD